MPHVVRPSVSAWRQARAIALLPGIVTVLVLLAGEAMLFGSPALLVWFAAFFASNYALFRLYEEPGLERRFGEDYRTYKRNVPRWLPRRTPWTPPSAAMGRSESSSKLRV